MSMKPMKHLLHSLLPTTSRGRKIIAALAALAVVGCSPDTERVFGDSPILREQQAATAYAAILEQPEQGWAVDYYPGELEYGGIAYTATFTDGRVTLACEQTVNNTQVDGRRYAAAEPVSSHYSIVNGRGVMLSFDTYNALLHYWSQPSGTDYDGYAGDYEFTFVSASADSVVMRGVKHGNLLRMYPLSEPAADYLQQVADMRGVLGSDVRKRLVADGTTVHVTAMENHIEFTDADGQPGSMPYVYTADGLRFYSPLTFNGVSALELLLNRESMSLRSPDGRMQLPAPTSLERFCGANTQWHFCFGRTDDSYLMCDELRSILKNAASQLSRQRYETLTDVYIGLNKLPREQDVQRTVMGWTSSYVAWAYEVCHGISMTVVDDEAQLVDIRATESGNLYYNYAAFFAPMLDFVTEGSPWQLTFDDPSAPASVKFTSRADDSKWFTLQLK